MNDCGGWRYHGVSMWCDPMNHKKPKDSSWTPGPYEDEPAPAPMKEPPDQDSGDGDEPADQ